MNNCEDSDKVVQGNRATAFREKDALNISEEFGVMKVEMLNRSVRMIWNKFDFLFKDGLYKISWGMEKTPYELSPGTRFYLAFIDKIG